MTKRLARTTALLTIVLYACIAPLRASADLPGSLIVTVTSPASGSVVTGTVPVNASVSVVGALTVAAVQFQADGVNIGTADTSAPYSVPWNTIAATNGSHDLTALARDSLGRTWTSNPVTVTVANDITAPTVSISAPASGATVSGTITVTANAADDIAVAGVQFFVDGIAGTDVTTAPYSIPWNTSTATNGSHTLTAVARDAAGNSTTSAPVTVTVANDSTAPTVSINQAAAQVDPTRTSPITFTAVFSEVVSGFGANDVTIGGTAGGTKTATVSGGPSTYTVAVSGMTTSGTVTVSIAAGAAQDAAGNGNTASTSTDNSVRFDAAAPTVSISSPASGATVSGTITVTASAADDTAVTGVQFFLDGIAGTDDTSAPFTAPWNTNTATNGSHTLTAVARDAAGNRTTSAPVTVTVGNDSTPPTVSINQAAAQADPTGASPISFTAVFSEAVSGFSAADVIIGGTAGGTKSATVSGGPTSYTVAVSGMTTSGTVTASIAAGAAQDAAGNNSSASTSSDNSVSFDAARPTVSINQAAAQADPTGASPITFTAVFSEAVSGFSAADVTIGGTAGGGKSTTVSGGPSTYTVAVSGMTTSGTVTANIAAGAAQDAAGNTSTASTSTDNQVTFDATPPSPPSTPDLAVASDSGVSST